MEKELQGRVGIVTGGSSGIGYAIANALAEAGATVYVISRTGGEKKGLEPNRSGVIHTMGDVTHGGDAIFGRRDRRERRTGFSGEQCRHHEKMPGGRLSYGGFRADLEGERDRHFLPLPERLSLS